MRVLVCGGRDYKDMDTIAKVLRMLNWFPGKNPPDTLVHGAAKGADSLADEWVKRVFGKSINVEPYPADWDTHGKAAGPIRNQQMLDTGIDLVVAFPGGVGTKDMVTRARKAGVPVLEV